MAAAAGWPDTPGPRTTTAAPPVPVPPGVTVAAAVGDTGEPLGLGAGVRLRRRRLGRPAAVGRGHGGRRSGRCRWAVAVGASEVPARQSTQDNHDSGGQRQPDRESAAPPGPGRRLRLLPRRFPGRPVWRGGLGGSRGGLSRSIRGRRRARGSRARGRRGRRSGGGRGSGSCERGRLSPGPGALGRDRRRGRRRRRCCLALRGWPRGPPALIRPGRRRPGRSRPGRPPGAAGPRNWCRTAWSRGLDARI